MAILAVLTIISCISLILNVYLKKTYSYWKDKSVISLPVLPFIGSYRELLLGKKHLSDYTQEIYKRHSDHVKFVGAYKGILPELIVMDPEIIRRILVKDFAHFHDRGMHQNEKDILSQHLFGITGEKWRMLRQKLTPTFTSSKMRQMYPLVLECGEQLQKYLEVALQENDVQEVREIMAKYTTDTIGSCAFGLKMSAMENEDSQFRIMGRRLMKPTNRKLFLRFISPIFPKLVKMFNARKSSLEMQTFFVDLVKELIRSRQENKSNRHDFMDLMMELRKEGHLAKDNFEITDELITAQAFIFFLAGFETSAMTIAYALRELALNTHVQTKLVDEIEITLRKFDGKLTYEAIQEMQYLDMVISETLRKYPPVAVLIRQCNSEYEIPNTNVKLDKDVLVMIPAYALHHDPKYYPDPEKFQPERFAKNVERTFPPFAYLPFGEGPRNCIGMRFAKLQMTTGLISILRQYCVESCDKTPMKIRFQPTSQVIASMDGIWLKVTPRI